MAVQPAQRIRVHPVEYGCPALGAFGSIGTNLLTHIDHIGRPVEKGADHQRGAGFGGISRKVGGCEALLVVILQEVEHIRLQILQELPVAGDSTGGGTSADDGSQVVVEAGFVVEKVESQFLDISAVVSLVVDLSYEEHPGILLPDLGNKPSQEFGRHHLHHVAAEAIHALGSPEEQYLQHFLPGIRMIVIDLAGIRPVIVVPAAYGQVLAFGGNVVGDVVYYDLEPSLMGTAHEIAEFLHPGAGIIGEIWVHIIIILYGIGGSGIAFDVRAAAGVAYHPCIPYRTDVQALEIIETLGVPVGKLSFAPDAGQYLIDYFHLLNSDTVIAAAIETFKDSAPPPKEGMVRARLHSAATASLIPSASLPSTISASEGRVLR